MHQSDKDLWKIEAFPDSISDLEKLTGKKFVSMKKGDNPLRITAKHSSPNGAERNLINQAEELGADAIVHTTYIPTFNVGDGFIDKNKETLYEPIIIMYGYCVKEEKTPEYI